MMKKIYPNVKLGKNVTIEDFVIIGTPPKGVEEGELDTIIGDNAIIRSHTVIYAGTIIGNNFQSGHHVLIREKNKIGDNVSIGSSSVIEHLVTIKDNVRIHSQVFVCEYSILDDSAWLGPNVTLTNAKYPQYKGVKDNLNGVHIEKNAKIGANATLLPGITIKESALIGAGSVVTKDVNKNTIVVGNPAHYLKESNEVSYK